VKLPAFLHSAGVVHTRVQYGRGDVIFRQGDSCDQVHFIESGTIKVSVISTAGKEGVVSILGPEAFLGEACLAGQPFYAGSATAMTPSSIIGIATHEMLRLLHVQHAISDRFIAHMLARNIRTESDLIDHLFNSSEKRLARTLLLLARYDKPSAPDHVVVTISQETLATMVGTTRSRINFFLKGFKQRGFIEYDGRALTIHRSLLTLVLEA
jgi:CRP/FNR family cyclic AMP-dependent transcriptional regulator